MKLTKFAIVGMVTVATLVGTGTGTMAHAADGGTLGSKADVNFIPNDTITNPVDPTDPGNPEVVVPVDPDHPAGTAGPLSIDYISNIHFGDQKISGNNEVYSAKLDQIKVGAAETVKDIPNYIQITDNRGSNAGWHLTVKQDGQFVNGTSELLGAVLSFENPTLNSASESDAPTATGFSLDPAGTSSDVMSAEEDQGMGTWVDMFGADATEAADSIKLSVPGKTSKIPGQYEATLTWELTDTPA
ncbi:cell surface protein [Listeria newyorkensis]|uniref:Cell surface protein n=1 Tax=Listeria newyorkensis TaxID=1497681 RepID=A0ABX4XRM5_9LIST|nr:MULTISPECIES: WxL domain-containing protein [Listeria]KGL39098.1 cell surface protein [Listeriaceae bacterium FSL A5-0209]KGL43925.1 cell surface protein [Listeria newyorkensis]KMT61796.1 cell surface protein [Listeria newyorkensis]PNP94942.1 cell surface protein [Listeria newyorkensis]RQW66318.1 WxL domain-containing protein [Listeria sp. SHR_NRA_18]